jgi:UPF0755 protein
MLKYVAIAAAALLLAAVGIGATAWIGWRHVNTPLALPDQGSMLVVAPGAPLSRVTADLERDGILTRPQILDWYARLRGEATRIHAGEYRLDAGTTPLRLLDKLVAGQVFLHQFTIVEGWRFVDMLAALRASPAIDAADASGDEIMAALGSAGVHPEGQFLPDTYRFPRGTKEIDVLRIAHEALQKRLADAWARRGDDVRLRGAYEALILASIVEKETAVPAERRTIAGVFHRRLERRMRLQTDPTVIYGLGDSYDGNLRRRDLSSDTPYNTYTRPGLPPTPIALPGGASIDAAVDPAAGDALFFVATGNPDGSHYFSATLEEHNQAVREYLRRIQNRID